VITEFAVPTAGTQPVFITAGPDGNLWFTEQNGNEIGRITTTGVITEFAPPTANSVPQGISSGPDGNVWFTEYSANKIGRVNIGPRYSVCLLYDPTKAVKSGATIPIKLQLCDGNGNDLSSSSITVQATGVSQISSSISGAIEDSGNANPDNNFRFDATLGSTGGYIFNLKTTGLPTGTYSVNFTVTGDSFVYAAHFQVK
jgi:virginiamycin B lyase